MRVTTEGQGVEQRSATPITAAATPGGEEQQGGPPEGVLADALVTLRDAVAAARFPLALVGSADAGRLAHGLVDQLDDYVLPRLRQLDAPLLAVVGGSTGAGKSTLVNSLVRTVVSPAGVLRPTTRSPVLVCHPDDAAWFSETHVLPGLARTTGATGNHNTLHLAPSLALTAGLAFLDAPDIDSVVEANRDLANQLLAAADLWLFVTTAARYADAVPWELLNQAQERGTALALVLNRVPDGAEQEVSQHLREMLAEHGVAEPTLFVLPEIQLEAGLLPENVVGPLQAWFTGLAASAEQRAAVVWQTLGGALASVAPRAGHLADASEAQVDTAQELRDAARGAYRAALGRVHAGIADGALLRGEVLARWQEFVGTGDLVRGLENRVGRLRDRLTAALSGRPPRATQLKIALETGLCQLVAAAAEQAAEDAVAAWHARPAGAALLRKSETDLGHSSPALAAEIDRVVRDWQGGVLELVRTEGASKRTMARLSAYGVNATGLVVMVAVFASTHLIPTGLEIAVAGGTTALSQKLLEALFGDQAVRRLADQARADLLDRVEVLLAGEEARFGEMLDSALIDPELPSRLRAIAAAVEVARRQLPGVGDESPESTSDATGSEGVEPADTGPEEADADGGGNAAKPRRSRAVKAGKTTAKVTPEAKPAPAPKAAPAPKTAPAAESVAAQAAAAVKKPPPGSPSAPEQRSRPSSPDRVRPGTAPAKADAAPVEPERAPDEPMTARAEPKTARAEPEEALAEPEEAPAERETAEEAKR